MVAQPVSLCQNRISGEFTETLLIGDAFVILKSEDDAVQALGRHKANIGERYVEVFRSTGAELHQVSCLLLDAKK